MPRRLLAALAVTIALTPAAAHAGIATDEMVACAALGPKHPGSAADNALADRLVDRFRTAGLETSVETFHMPVWEPGPVSLKIDAGPGAGTAYPAETFAYSGTGDVRAEVVDLKSGGPSDYSGKDVKGKIVLVDRSETYHRSVQIEQAMDRGAAAMLLVSASPDNLIQTGSVRWAMRPQASIPALTVGSGDGAKLRAQMAEGTVTLAASAKGERVDKLGRNVVGVRKGSTHPDQYVVVAGHYDSWYDGAFDNCTAVGSLLGMIDANPEPAYTTMYIGWDAEETGLVGSYSWIARHQDLIPKTVLNVNLEETASATFVNGDATQLPSLQLAAGTSSPAVLGLLAGSAASTAFTPVIVPIFGLRNASGGIIPTDLEGFYGQGVQGFTTAGTSPYYHTTADTQDKINTTDLERVTTFLVDVVRKVQSIPPELLLVREVPTVKVTAPATAAAGAEVPVDIEIIGVDGAPVTGNPPLVLANQRDNWSVAESRATEVGDGHYAWTLPAGATDSGTTRIRATASDPIYFANGFANVDQRSGGLIEETRSCRSRRVIRLHVKRRLGAGHRIKRVRVRAAAGTLRVRTTKRQFVIRLDLRGVGRRPVKVRITARTNRGKIVRQTRTFRTCVSSGSRGSAR